MPGQPVTVGCVVTHTTGGAVGTITQLALPTISANGALLATSGATCDLVTSSGNPLRVVIGLLASQGVTVGGRALVRVGDQIPSGSGILTIVGPPAAIHVNDNWP